MSTRLDELRREMFDNYVRRLSLPESYLYFYGNPVRPVVPKRTATDGIMILGAYPSARFECIGRYLSVPVADLAAPFSGESYFDGRRFRTVRSSDELDSIYLNPMGISRGSCWITNLVKVFLFKDGHIKAYRDLGVQHPPCETRSMFFKLATHDANFEWLAREIEIARPRLVITLGAEVAAALAGRKTAASGNNLLSGTVREVRIGSMDVPAVCLAHPGIVMRGGTRNPWPELTAQHIQELKGSLPEVLGS